MRAMTAARISILALMSLALLAIGCKSEPTMSSLAEQNKAGVEAFIEQLLEVEAKLDAAPKAADGFEVEDDVELRPYDEDGKLGNTVVIHQRDLGGWLKNTPDRIEYDPPELGPRSSLELQRLVVWTRTKRWTSSDNTSKTNIEPFQRVITWYPQNQYQAIVFADEVVDYSTEDTSKVGRWKGRVALFDMKAKAWRGALSIDLAGDPVSLKEYALFDASGRQLGPGSTNKARDVSNSKRAFQQALERAVTVALKTKKPVDSLAQVAPKSSKASSSKRK